jgi:hypothetical protein
MGVRKNWEATRFLSQRQRSQHEVTQSRLVHVDAAKDNYSRKSFMESYSK